MGVEPAWPFVLDQLVTKAILFRHDGNNILKGERKRNARSGRVVHVTNAATLKEGERKFFRNQNLTGLLVRFRTLSIMIL